MEEWNFYSFFNASYSTISRHIEYHTRKLETGEEKLDDGGQEEKNERVKFSIVTE